MLALPDDAKTYLLQSTDSILVINAENLQHD